MRILIDGHNAIFALRLKGTTHEAQRRELLRRVRALASKATVFFDARHARHAGGRELGVEAVFCRSHEADAAILAAVRRAERPDALVVVSNDRELAGRASQLGARVLRVAEFFGRHAAAAAAELPRVPRGRWRFEPKDFGLPDEVDLERTDPDDL